MDSACPSAAVAKTVTGTSGQGRVACLVLAQRRATQAPRCLFSRSFIRNSSLSLCQYRHPQQLDRQPPGRERLCVRTGRGPGLEGGGDLGSGLRSPTSWLSGPCCPCPGSQGVRREIFTSSSTSRGDVFSGERDREFGMGMHTLLHLRWITHKVPYSTWNSAQGYVEAWMVGGLGENNCLYMCGRIPSLFP